MRLQTDQRSFCDRLAACYLQRLSFPTFRDLLSCPSPSLTLSRETPCASPLFFPSSRSLPQMPTFFYFLSLPPVIRPLTHRDFLRAPRRGRASPLSSFFLRLSSNAPTPHAILRNEYFISPSSCWHDAHLSPHLGETPRQLPRGPLSRVFVFRRRKGSFTPR